MSQSVLPSLAYNLKLRNRVVEEFQASVKGGKLSEDYDFLMSQLKEALSESKTVASESLQVVTLAQETSVQEAPDFLFREGEHLKELKLIYLKEMQSLKLQQASSERLVEKAYK